MTDRVIDALDSTAAAERTGFRDEVRAAAIDEWHGRAVVGRLEDHRRGNGGRVWIAAAAAVLVAVLGLGVIAVKRSQQTVEQPDRTPVTTTASTTPATSTPPTDPVPSTTVTARPTTTATTTATTTVATTASANAPAWDPLPLAPIIARSGHSLVWTGHEVIVWGGADADARVLADGAAYDPDTKHWRTLAAAPIAARHWHTAVWTGTEMLVWGGEAGGCSVALADGAAYDPATDTWRVVSSKGAVGRWGHQAVWTGTEMVVFGGSPSEGTDIPGNEKLCNPPPPPPPQPWTGLAYDPAADRWRALAPPPPGADVFNATMVWDGREVLLWGGMASGQPDPFSGRGLAYNPATDSWNELPPAPISGRDFQAGVWTGRELLVFGGQDATGLRSDGAAYDPATRQWRSIPSLPAPNSFSAAATTGSKVVVVGGCCGEPNTVMFDIRAETWSSLPDPPTDCTNGCSDIIDAPLVSTGSEVVTWGGTATILAEEPIDTLRPDGASLDVPH